MALKGIPKNAVLKNVLSPNCVAAYAHKHGLTKEEAVKAITARSSCKIIEFTDLSDVRDALESIVERLEKSSEAVREYVDSICKPKTSDGEAVNENALFSVASQKAVARELAGLFDETGARAYLKQHSLPIVETEKAPAKGGTKAAPAEF